MLILTQEKWWVGESVERGCKFKSKKHVMFLSDLFDIQRWAETNIFEIRSLMIYVMILNGVDGVMQFAGAQSKTFEDFENFSNPCRASVLKTSCLAQGS
jgi:hypothetical protein